MREWLPAARRISRQALMRTKNCITKAAQAWPGAESGIMLAAVILSGGASRRMASPKALLPYQGQPFLEHFLQITVHEKIGARRVVLGADAEPIAAAVKLRPDEVVRNEDWEQGQLTSIHAALRSLPPGTDGMLLCLIDHP